jgi:hypothetical protein
MSVKWSQQPIMVDFSLSEEYFQEQLLLDKKLESWEVDIFPGKKMIYMKKPFKEPF